MLLYSIGQVFVEMRYKPERALTLALFIKAPFSAFDVEMRYKPERALTLNSWNKQLNLHCGFVEMRYKPERALTHPVAPVVFK